ncbi:MAG: energy-coupled thiamine transporter ThiT [Angelakisella sp.]
MRNEKTKTLVECALLTAIAVILSKLQFAPWPQGGSITVAAMAPLVLLSLRHGWKWGILSSFVFSLLQMLLEGIAPPPVTSFLWYALVVLLDYVVAYTVLGLASIFFKLYGKNRFAVPLASVSVTLLRYLCHFVSGIAIWGIYAPEGWPAWLHSLVYNGSYMIPETIITAVVVTLLYKLLQRTNPAKA